MKKDVLKIFEIKTCSPFGFTSPYSFNQLFEKVKNSDADMISIHTDKLWEGDYSFIWDARRTLQLPILAKGFHPTDAHVEAALNAGATYVLTVGWYSEKYNDKTWYEVENLEEFEKTNAKYVIWNRRNPRTGAVRPESLEDVAGVAKGRWWGQASLAKSWNDISPSIG